MLQPLAFRGEEAEPPRLRLWGLEPPLLPAGVGGFRSISLRLILVYRSNKPIKMKIKNSELQSEISPNSSDLSLLEILMSKPLLPNRRVCQPAAHTFDNIFPLFPSIHHGFLSPQFLLYQAPGFDPHFE